MTSAIEAIPDLNALMRQTCYGSLTSNQHENLDEILDTNPQVKETVFGWADRCFRRHDDDRANTCESHRDEAPEYFCNHCDTLLTGDETGLCRLCRILQDCAGCGKHLKYQEREKGVLCHLCNLSIEYGEIPDADDLPQPPTDRQPATANAG